MFFKSTLEDRIENAKKDDEELNKLIEEYKPFIASTVQKRTRRFLSYGHDDELTIGMMAFKEAIDSYDRSKGKFLSFAKQVINLRMIDYYRKHKKEENVIYLEQVNHEEEDCSYDLGTIKAIEEYRNEEENEARKLEILQYKKELSEWQIEFSDLVKVSPKQDKVRKVYKEIAHKIVSDKQLLDTLLSKKRLPIKEIQNAVHIHRKKLERGRIYIISLVIIMNGDYTYLKEYMDWR